MEVAGGRSCSTPGKKAASASSRGKFGDNKALWWVSDAKSCFLRFGGMEQAVQGSSYFVRP